MPFQEVNSQKGLGMLFHSSLSWHLHTLSLHQRAMLHINCVGSIANLLPGFALLYIISLSFCRF